MADFFDDFSDASVGVDELVDGIDGIDTGNSPAETSADGTPVVDWTDANAPSLINANSSDDSSDVPFDLSISQPSQSQLDAVDNIVQSVADSADYSYDPNSEEQQSFLDGLLNSVFGTGSNNSATQKSAAKSTKSASAPSGSSMGSGSSGGASAKPASSTPQQATQQKANSAPASPVVKYLNAPSGVANITNIALILGIITSLIVIYVFLKKGTT